MRPHEEKRKRVEENGERTKELRSNEQRNGEVSSQTREVNSSRALLFSPSLPANAFFPQCKSRFSRLAHGAACPPAAERPERAREMLLHNLCFRAK